MREICILLILVGLLHGVSNASQCTAQGRYPNNDAENCRGYTMCLIGGSSNFTQYKLTCPEGFVYSHLELQCTNNTGYKCSQSYNCSVEGSFVDPSTKNCTSFISCVKGIKDLVTARVIECPSYTLFNPNTAKCVNETEFNCNFKSLDLNYTVLESFEFSNNFTFNKCVPTCAGFITLFCLLVVVVSK